MVASLQSKLLNSSIDHGELSGLFKELGDSIASKGGMEDKNHFVSC